MVLSEYSNNIINFIESSVIQQLPIEILNKNYKNFPIITKLEKIINDNWLSIKEIESKIIIKVNKYINKLHTKNEYPLMYMLLKNSNYFNNNFNDYDTFREWFNNNNHKINYNIIQNIKKQYHSLLYNPPDERKKLHDILYKNNFVSLDIQQSAEIIDIKYIHLEFIDELEGLNIHLYYVPNHKPNIRLIINICYIMHKIAQNSNSPVKNYPLLTIYCGMDEKKITSTNGPLTSNNINSGATYPGKTVEIWRYEELYKVLIHELIHFYEFDFYIMDKGYDKIEKYIYNSFCLNDDSFDRPNESYTETLTIIIHSLILSKYLQMDFNKLIIYEISFSSIQLYKILKYFKYIKKDITIDNFMKNDKCDCNSMISQRTSVLSYYIIKFFLLLSYDEFIKFISDNMIIKNRLNEFIILLNKCIHNTSLKELINKMKNINITNEYIKNTLRMSALSPK